VDPTWEGGIVQLDKATRAEAARLSKEIAVAARAGLALPGTLTHRRTRCGKAGCRCSADPPILHGPYWSWTRKIENKTVTRYLSDEEVADYQVFFENAKQLRSLLAELEALSLSVIEERARSSRSVRRAR
jgi:Family of unknown function (DUF6788)